jgi:hypothetical protein
MIAIQLCTTDFDSKLCAHSTIRYMIRTGVCQNRFDIGPLFRERSCCFDTFTRTKSNAYKSKQTNMQHPIQFYLSAGLLLMQTGDVDLHYLAKFSSEKDVQEAGCPLDCWKTYSEFAIYERKSECTTYCMENFATIPNSILSVYPDNRISFSRDDYSHYYLILPWFDRVDRMIFSAYLTRFFVILKKFNFELQTFCPYLELAVIILEYL